MNFFKNVKFNYYSKLIAEHIKEGSYQNLKKIFDKAYNEDFNLFYSLFNRHYKNVIDLPRGSFFNNSLIWINSFLHEDTLILSNFLKFYFSRINKTGINFLKYSDKIFEANKSINLIDASFNHLVANTYFYQYFIESCYQQDELNVILNDIPFFEGEKSMMFTSPNITKCFFYIVRDPLEALNVIKTKTNDLDYAINEILNLDHRPFYIKSDNSEQTIEIIKKDWSTHVQSWTGDNVVEGFNGNIINIRELNTNPVEVFYDVIAHLIQAGLEINLDYKIIEDYCNEVFLKSNVIEKELISNNKKKLFKSISGVSNQWGFDL